MQGPDGQSCFRCARCRGGLEAGYFHDPMHEGGDKLFCYKCYGHKVEKSENVKHMQEEQVQLKHTAELEHANACVWSDLYRGRSADTLFLFDDNPKDHMVENDDFTCILIDEESKEIHIGSVHDRAHSTNLEYFVEACKYISLNDGNEPVFSLDPDDPHDLGGEKQKKRFIPSCMADGSFGEVGWQYQTNSWWKQLWVGNLRHSSSVQSRRQRFRSRRATGELSRE